MTIEVIKGLRAAIFAIALPTPPAPITSAFMDGLSYFLKHTSYKRVRGRLSLPITFAKHLPRVMVPTFIAKRERKYPFI
jgi:hypothetical protein